MSNDPNNQAAQPGATTTAITIAASTPATGVLATYQEGTAGVQSRQTLNVDVSIDNITAISVTKTAEALRGRLSEANGRIREQRATAEKLSASVDQSFVNWHAQFKTDARYKSVADTLFVFEPGTGQFDERDPEIKRDWTRGIASSTLSWSYITGTRKVGATIVRNVEAEIPADVRTVYNDYLTATREIATTQAEIEAIRRTLANPGQIEQLARARVAEHILKKSGQQQLVDDLAGASVSDEFIDGLVDSIRTS